MGKPRRNRWLGDNWRKKLAANCSKHKYFTAEDLDLYIYDPADHMDDDDEQQEREEREGLQRPGVRAHQPQCKHPGTPLQAATRQGTNPKATPPPPSSLHPSTSRPSSKGQKAVAHHMAAAAAAAAAPATGPADAGPAATAAAAADPEEEGQEDAAVEYIMYSTAQVYKEPEGGLWTDRQLVKAAARGDTQALCSLLSGSNWLGCGTTRASRAGCQRGWTAVHAAVASGQLEALRSLLTWLAPLDCKTAAQGATPLHVAAAGEGKGCAATAHRAIELLAEGGADLQARDDASLTPLHAAARAGQSKALRALLACGADVAERANDGSTPLHAAVRGWAVQAALNDPPQGRHLCTIRLLLGARADPEAPDAEGMTPLSLAAASTHVEGASVVLGLLEEAAERRLQGTAEGSLLAAAKRGDAGPLLLLLLAGVPADTRDRQGRTALALASGGGHDESVKVLLCNGADVAARCGNQADTPLHAAVRGWQLDEQGIETVRALLAAGADPEAANSAGETPLSMAAGLGEEGAPLRELLEEKVGWVWVDEGGGG